MEKMSISTKLPRVVAFSGGKGKDRISSMKGGRQTVACHLGYEFPEIKFLPRHGKTNVDLVLTPNSTMKSHLVKSSKLAFDQSK